MIGFGTILSIASGGIFPIVNILMGNIAGALIAYQNSKQNIVITNLTSSSKWYLTRLLIRCPSAQNLSDLVLKLYCIISGFRQHGDNKHHLLHHIWHNVVYLQLLQLLVLERVGRETDQSNKVGSSQIFTYSQF
jgi:hypothetical protein